MKSLTPPPPKQPSVAPHPKSYMEVYILNFSLLRAFLANISMLFQSSFPGVSPYKRSFELLLVDEMILFKIYIILMLALPSAIIYMCCSLRNLFLQILEMIQRGEKPSNIRVKFTSFIVHVLYPCALWILKFYRLNWNSYACCLRRSTMHHQTRISHFLILV